MSFLSTKFGGLNVAAGYFGDFLDLTGVNAADAAKEAADVQLKATKDALAETRAAREQTRTDLSPFRQSGETALGGLPDLITDQNTQKDFISNNPLLDFINKTTQKNLEKSNINQGQHEKTGRQLNENLSLFAPDLLQQSVTGRMNLAKLGASAAAQQATQTLASGQNITELLAQGANAQAAGVVGAQNARTDSQQQAASTLAAIYS